MLSFVVLMYPRLWSLFLCSTLVVHYWFWSAMLQLWPILPPHPLLPTTHSFTLWKYHNTPNTLKNSTYPSSILFPFISYTLPPKPHTSYLSTSNPILLTYIIDLLLIFPTLPSIIRYYLYQPSLFFLSETVGICSFFFFWVRAWLGTIVRTGSENYHCTFKNM